MRETTGSGLRLLIAGATGLVGREVLTLALADRRVSRVVAPTRRPLPSHPNLDNPIVGFDHLPENASWWNVDAIISTLGTTIRKAGSQAAFRTVDHDYIVAVARLGRLHGARSFALTSAMGANAGSLFFYNRVKGETETSIAALGYPSVTIVRPGVIGGKRGESRPAEQFALRLLKAVNPLLPRSARISPAVTIARTLLDAALAGEPGQRVIGAAALAD